MPGRTIPMTDSLYDYLCAHGTREPEILRRLRAETATIPMAGMLISPDQGQFMALLIELIGARRTLEVGTFTGYSALAVALALPPDGRVTACDVSEEWTSIGRRYWAEAGVAHKIDLRLAPATETLAALLAGGQAGSLHFAFIHADKTNYAAYFVHAVDLFATPQQWQARREPPAAPADGVDLFVSPQQLRGLPSIIDTILVASHAGP